MECLPVQFHSQYKSISQRTEWIEQGKAWLLKLPHALNTNAIRYEFPSLKQNQQRLAAVLFYSPIKNNL